ncbi:MAG: calcium/sodium antiporter [Cardiobacteriales bacterium]|nr:MAG: calcium/sodium antiporter [Cardiobacteriales bacterium]
MLLAAIALIVGLMLLIWSADRFIDGASATAHQLGMPPLLIGMLIIGLGTSVPEMLVSAIAAIQGNPGIALGNAFGSNISNIGLIMGLTALAFPILVHSTLVKKELPILLAITALTAYLLADTVLSRKEAWILLIVFFAFVFWSIIDSMRSPETLIDAEDIANMPLKKAVYWLIVGVLLLVIASRLMVWGAVVIATKLGVDDLIIGLTILAIGTSLPELASTLMAARKRKYDLAFGNIIGSNIFNTLVVVGIAGTIHPMQVASEVFSRDILIMSILTLALFVMSFKIGGRIARINRLEGGILLMAFIAYNAYLIYGAIQTTTLPN